MRRRASFLERHRWSLSLSLLSAISFVRLASELREGELDAFDAALAEPVVHWRGRVDGLMLGLTELGSARSIAGLALILVAVLIARKRRKEAAFLVTSTAGSFALDLALKAFFQRARPDARLGYLIPEPSSFSFPSGHAMGSMGLLAGVVVVVHALRLSARTRAAAIAIAVTLLFGVMLSRVYFGVHFPSDVLGGAFAGAAWVSAITGWFYPRLLPGEESGSDTRTG